MPANTQIASGTTPWADPNEISASSPQDVWFQYSFENTGDEDDDTNGWYYVLADANGTYLVNEFAPPDTIPAGGQIQQGARIDGSTLAAQSGTLWVTLYSPQGEQVGAASIVVNP